MIELRIDGKLAEIPANLEFSFVIENPYFTDASEYTEEIELYPRSPRNAKIFGSVYRHEKSKDKVVKDCELRVNNRIWLKGKSTTTEYTDRSIKLQLLGGNSAVNYLIAFENLYIDEMELGRYNINRWLDIFDPKYYNIPGKGTNWQGFAQKIMAKPEDCEWVMLPAQNLEGEEINAWNRFWPGPEQSHARPDGTTVEMGFGYPIATAWKNGEYNEKYALQPRLTSIVKRVVKALGYEVIEFDAEETPLKYIYYVNVKDTFYLNEMLPHWSVSEFLNQIQNYFGCIFVFDTKNNTCKIKNRGSFINNEIINIKNIDDRFNVNFNDENEDIKISNLKYAECEIGKVFLFDDYANENAEVMEFGDMENLEKKLNAAPKNVVGEYKGKNYIIHYPEEDLEEGSSDKSKEKSLEEVNHLGNKYDKKVKEKIELKIVPANIVGQRGYEIFYNQVDPYFSFTRRAAEGESPNSNETFEIDLYLHEGIEKKVNSLDLMRVAVFRSWEEIEEYTTAVFVNAFDINAYIGRTKDYDMWTYHKNIPNYIKTSPTLALRKIDGYDTLYSLGIDKAKIVNTNAPHEFTIYDEIEPEDMNKTFVIRNKKYLCEKIELIIDNKGIKKAKKGTFYRID